MADNRRFANLKRVPLPGLLLALGGLQYFVCYIVAALATNQYSYVRDSISDLGATNCLRVLDSTVCSPDHGLINASLIALGLLSLAGLVLLAYKSAGRYWRAGLAFLGLTSICVVLVGLFPTNEASKVHSVFSNLVFPNGVLGIILLVLSRRFGRLMGNYSMATALVSLVFQLIHFANGDFWRYAGLAERLAADPQVLWILIFGFYLIIRKVSYNSDSSYTSKLCGS